MWPKNNLNNVIKHFLAEKNWKWFPFDYGLMNESYHLPWLKGELENNVIFIAHMNFKEY